MRVRDVEIWGKVKILDTKTGDLVWHGNFDIIVELMVAQMMNDAAAVAYHKRQGRHTKQAIHEILLMKEQKKKKNEK